MNLIKQATSLFNQAAMAKSFRVMLLRVVGVILFFLITLFLTNNFEAELVGKYDFSRSLLLFLGVIAVFGMQQSIIYYSGFLAAQKDRGYLKRVYRKMVLMVLVLSALIYGVGQLLKVEWIQEIVDFQVNDTASKTILAVFMYGLTLLNIDAFRAIDKIYTSEWYRNVVRYAFFGAAVLFIFYTDRLDWLVEVFLLNFALLALISSIHLAVLFSKETATTGNTTISLKKILKRSAPMALSATSFLLIQSMDVLMLTYYTNFETVAYYSAAVKLTALVGIVLASVNAVIAPKISEFFASDRWAELKQLISKGTQLIFLMTSPLIIVLLLFSHFILGVFGEGYTLSKVALWILLIGQIINAFCGSVGVYLNMTNKQNVFLIILSLALVLNIVLNVALIPSMGMKGAALATTISTISWNLAATIYVYKKDGVRIFLKLR